MAINDDIKFLKSLNENELCELIIIPLLEAMEYYDIRYIHGAQEYGKDIVFCKNDPFANIEYFCATVKQYKLSGSVTSSKSILTILHQINQALNEPFIEPLNGKEIYISKIFVITAYEISQTCILSIKRELSNHNRGIFFIDGPRLHSLIENYLPKLLSILPDPESRFFQSLIQRLLVSHNSTKLGALRELSLTDIYTGGSLSPTTKVEAKYISFAKPEEILNKLNPLKLLNKYKFLVILADVGCGKTTLLKKIAYDIVKNGIKKNGERILPFLIPLHLLPKESFISQSSFLEKLSAFVRDHNNYNKFNIKNINRYLLLLDGFDELASNHNEASKCINELINNNWAGIIISSRPSRIPELFSSFSYYKLNPFNKSEIIDFLHKWFAHDYASGQKIIEKILSDVSLFSFCRTPLLLTLYAILSERLPYTDLPIRRTDLYSLISELLLGKWDQLRQIHNQFDYEIKGFVLEKIALSMQKEEIRTISKMKLIKEIKNIISNKDSWEIDLFLNELIYRSSLIRLCDKNTIEFVHLSFQEFFAAKRIIRTSNIKFVQTKMFNSWWKGTLFFYFGLKRSLDELQFKSKKNTYFGYGLVLMEFLTEANFTTDKIKNKIMDIVAKDLLHNHNLTDSDIKYCTQIGMPLIKALKPVIEDQYFNGIIFNYIRVIFTIDLEKSDHLIKNATELLKKLKFDELLWVLNELISFLVNNDWLNYFNYVCKILTWQNSHNIDKVLFKRRLSTITKNIQHSINNKKIGKNIGNSALKSIDLIKLVFKI